MKHGIVEGKGLQLFCGYQDVDSSITFLNSIFQIIKQGLDDFNGILLVSMKQSIRCTHYQYTITVYLKDATFLWSRYLMTFYVFLS